MTVSPRKALGFRRRLAGNELAMLPLWPQPRVVTARRARVRRARCHGPTKGVQPWAWQARLGPGSLAVGCSEA
jgi:hypothetical protein